MKKYVTNITFLFVNRQKVKLEYIANERFGNFSAHTQKDNHDRVCSDTRVKQAKQTRRLTLGIDLKQMIYAKFLSSWLYKIKPAWLTSI